MNKEMGRLRTSNNELFERNKKLQDIMAQLKSRIEALKVNQDSIFKENELFREDMARLRKQVVRLVLQLNQVREQRTNISRQLGWSEKTLMEVRNACAVQARDLHAVQSQVVWLAEWCQKKFGIEIGGMLGVADWPKRICEVVAKIVDGNCDSKLKQVGWYSPLAKDQISMQTKLNLPKACNHYSVPVFISEG